MADTTLLLPSSGSSVAKAGTAWSNPTNIQTDAGTYATCDIAAFSSSDYLYASNFGFAIPAGAVIDGITVEVKRNAATYFGGQYIVEETTQLYNGALVGDNKSTGVAWAATDEIVTFGGAVNTWNAGLTDVDVNASNFGVYISANMTQAINLLASVAYVKVQINYSVFGAPDVVLMDTAIVGVDATARIYHYDQRTTKNLPLVAGQDSTIGSEIWNSVNSIKTIANASYNNGGSAGSAGTYGLSATDFSFNIPTDKVIEGVIVTISKQNADLTPFEQDNNVQLLQGNGFSYTRLGSDRSLLGLWSTNQTEYYYGDTTDDWGVALTPTMINDVTFGVGISSVASGGGTNNIDPSIYYIQMEVFYTSTPPSTIVAVDTLSVSTSVFSSSLPYIEPISTANVNSTLNIPTIIEDYIEPITTFNVNSTLNIPTVIEDYNEVIILSQVSTLLKEPNVKNDYNTTIDILNINSTLNIPTVNESYNEPISTLAVNSTLNMPIINNAYNESLVVSEISALLKIPNVKNDYIVPVNTVLNVNSVVNDVTLIERINVDLSTVNVLPLSPKIDIIISVTSPDMNIMVNTLDPNIHETLLVDTVNVNSATYETIVSSANIIVMEGATVDVNFNGFKIDELIEVNKDNIAVNVYEPVLDEIFNVDKANIITNINEVNVKADVVISRNTLSIPIVVNDVNVNNSEYIPVNNIAVDVKAFEPVTNESENVSIKIKDVTASTNQANIKADVVINNDTLSIPVFINEVNVNNSEYIAVDNISIDVTVFEPVTNESEVINIEIKDVNVLNNDVNINESFHISTTQISANTIGVLVRFDEYIEIDPANVIVTINSASVKLPLNKFNIEVYSEYFKEIEDNVLQFTTELIVTDYFEATQIDVFMPDGEEIEVILPNG